MILTSADIVQHDTASSPSNRPWRSNLPGTRSCAIMSSRIYEFTARKHEKNEIVCRPSPISARNAFPVSTESSHGGCPGSPGLGAKRSDRRKKCDRERRFVPRNEWRRKYENVGSGGVSAVGPMEDSAQPTASPYRDALSSHFGTERDHAMSMGLCMSFL